MSTPATRSQRLCALLAACVALLLGGCDYDVPLSTRPERPVDGKLAGNWLSPHGWMMVRAFDPENYVVVHNGNTFRAWHSTVEGVAYVTIQSLDAAKPKYAYLTYTLAADERRLDVRVVRDDVIPKTIKDTAAMRQAIAQHAGDTAHLGNPEPFTRMK